jgi:signal transduction histidine kinase
VSHNGAVKITQTIPGPPRPGVLAFVGFQATLPTPGELHRLLIESAIALAIMAVVSIGLGWMVAGRVLRPLRAMTTTARHISEESLDERLAVRGPADELKDLGDTIDGLLGRLEKAFEAQRRFVANASHELRTPLAMMRTSLDVALGKPAPVPAEVTVLAGKLEEGLDQADKLLEGLLLLARAQQGRVAEMAEVSLAGLVAEALDVNRAEIARQGLIVDDAVAEVEVVGNETLLARLVGNLIDNAVRHNVAGGPVHVSSRSAGDRVRLVVENGGPVIPDGQAQHLGEPFFRLGAERVAHNDGTGLGLSIVRAIAAGHGGSLQMEARPEGGLRVVVDLPAAPVRV